MTEFPHPEYKRLVLKECFDDAKRFFLDAMLKIDLAHLVMLTEQGIITKPEAKTLLEAIKSISKEEILKTEYDGSFEDLFYLIQQKIKQKVKSDVAGKLHTARSRNDIDVTLYRIKLREFTLKLIDSVLGLRSVLLELSSRYSDSPMPAYTHTQPAQPTTIGHFLLAMIEALRRDTHRFFDSYRNLNMCPLGAAAITTSGFPINRFRTAELLGFDEPVRNSYGAIASVDYFTQLVSTSAILMINIGKFVYEFLLMSMQEFGVIWLPDGFVQGSSIMPQKRNPVALEHTRAISSRALGELTGVMIAVHNTPFGDINDVEDDLQPLIFTGLHNAYRATDLLRATLENAKFNTEKLRHRAEENFITVTELADELVRKFNLSFKDSHQVVSRAVKLSLEINKPIDAEILKVSSREVLGKEIVMAEEEIRQILSAENFIQIRKAYGGTSSEQVKSSIEDEKRLLSKDKSKLYQIKEKLLKADEMLENEVIALLQS
ncbi:MAG: argininosuccinate lyase [Pyrinomonadaceae bacterium]|nr:argininosuccinate lyase [Pyrinomonadaceae bacterium]MCX7639330.1 argininosuccinate lyase [Pyrinomonadaceae bacterium]MDW8303442.1 argininosuccinate lyase [Acidobacteriota bacterium]